MNRGYILMIVVHMTLVCKFVVHVTLVCTFFKIGYNVLECKYRLVGSYLFNGLSGDLQGVHGSYL